MSAYSKTVVRLFKSNMGRFIAITMIILLGIAFVSGLSTISPIVRASFDESLKGSNVSDIIVKTESLTGFNEGQLDKLKGIAGVKEAQPITSMDMELGGENARVQILPLGDMKINVLELKEGRFPKLGQEIIVEQESDFIKKRELGEEILIMDQKFTVVGIAKNPLIFVRGGEPDIINKEPLELIAYIDSELFKYPMPITDVYVKLSGAVGLNIFSKKYMDFVKTSAEKIAEKMGDNSLHFLTLDDNKSFKMLESYAEKVDIISLIFPVFFIAVAALVVLTTMSRMIEEERSVMGCLRTLGYSSGKIAMKYIWFSLLCSLLGSLLGIAVGVTLLPAVIYPAFNTFFFLPAMKWNVSFLPGIISLLAMSVAVVSVTSYLAAKSVKEKPADLLRSKAPKVGKKVFLEHITFIWKHMKFRYKSTFRNVFRYVNHLIMTVVSVAGSTALVLAGFGLLDVSTALKDTSNVGAMASSFTMISSVVIAFAGVLCVLVIYNLTNMNIGERKREIATLKVLGYMDVEVSGYIYREVLIMALLGIFVGIPLGYFLLYFVLGYLDFGSVADVKWYSYLIAAGAVILFIGLVDLLLLRKIRGIDMNDSLKSVE